MRASAVIPSANGHSVGVTIWAIWFSSLKTRVNMPHVGGCDTHSKLANRLRNRSTYMCNWWPPSNGSSTRSTGAVKPRNGWA
jgi:hypothetical protein